MIKYHRQVIEKTKNWIEKFIIDLSICPFASKPFIEGRIQYLTCEIDADFRMIQETFLEVILQMHEDLQYSNSFVIIADKCSFDEYLDMYYFLEELLKKGNLDSMFQLASFHPDYMYDGTTKKDLSNYRNRSPYPMIHVLRVNEVEMAIEEYGDTSKITRKNVELLADMDVEELLNKINQKR